MKKYLVFIIILLLVSVNVSGGFLKESNDASMVFEGNILYVGGSGPNNYTSIQGAIDDAVDGDTVFVYDDSSPYYESLIINKSISLIGEDKNTTIIDGSNQPSGIKIESTNSVIVSSFTLENSYGIGVFSNYSTISNNIIKPYAVGNDDGIFIWGEGNIIEENVVSSFSYGIFTHGGENYIVNNSIINNYIGIGGALIESDLHIIGNLISDNDYGIYFLASDSKYNTIIGNKIVNNEDDGIFIANLEYTNISHNEISSNGGDGMYIWSDYTFISYNNISSNEDGIVFGTNEDCKHCNVSYNFISNNGNGIFQRKNYPFWHEDKCNSNLQVFHNDFIDNWRGVVLGTDGNKVSCNNFIDNDKQASFIATIHNYWDGNYWSDSQRNPHVIWGRIGIIFNLIPWVNFDYNPASEPYDIN